METINIIDKKSKKNEDIHIEMKSKYGNDFDGITTSEGKTYLTFHKKPVGDVKVD